MNADEVVYVCEKLGWNYTNRRNEVDLSCPFARWNHPNQSDRNPSAGIKPDEEISLFNCFTCDQSGSLRNILHRLKEYHTSEKRIQLLQEAAEFVEDHEKEKLTEKDKEKVDQEKTIYKETKDDEVWPEQEIEPFKGKVPSPILDRGISIETCKEWELGYDKYQKRAVFPVRNKNGGLVGIVGKTLVDKSPKYKNYWNFQAKKYLFGEDKLKRDNIVIVEGIIDTILWNQYGINTVGLFGTKLSKKRIEKLEHRLPQNSTLYLALDEDDAGIKASNKIIEKLESSTITNIKYVEFKDGEDPADCSRPEIAKTALQNAKHYLIHRKTSA